MKLRFVERSGILLLLIVGSATVPQHIPLAVISSPHSAVILPPEIALVDVIEITSVVVKVGNNVVSWLVGNET
jgi:hypothetical protein